MGSSSAQAREIRVPSSDADLERCTQILAAVDGSQLSIDQLRPAQDRLLLHEGGGYAYVNRSSVHESAYGMVRVLPSERGRGIGTQLVAAAAAATRALGLPSMWGVVQGADDASLRFANVRGFAEVGREVELTRHVAAGDGRIRDGIVELREEHRRGAYAVSVAAVADMPTAGEARGRAFEDWLTEELSDAAAAFVAVHEGTVVGYATFQRFGEDEKRLEHGFTGVLPAYRRQGIATALGEAQLAWAAAHGYEQLVTTTGVTNVGLRRQKAKLGYTERPGPVLVRGPV
jgi:GNAT superfamily N-acetyltransferase